MSNFEHARRALLGLVALAGTAAADGTGPTPDPTTTQAPTPPPVPDDTTTPDMPDTTTTTTTTTTTEPPPPPAPPPLEAPSATTYTETTYEEPKYVPPESTLERYGIAVALGGGVEGFTDDTARATTNDGGQWNVRLAVGTRSPIGFEAAYIGSAQTIDALGLDNDALLVGNGVEGKIRVNLLDAAVQPFAFGGVGWRRYSLARTDFNTSAIEDEDDVLEIPLGAGVATKYRGFMFDARAEYRIATQEDLLPSLNGNDDASLHRWGINANVGVAF